MDELKKHKYFIDIATGISGASKDPSTKVGCVIVSDKNTIISTGYNGFIRGCNEAYMTWDRPMKYKLVIHSEINALNFAPQSDLTHCSAYLTHGPCPDCLKNMLQRGIRNIYYKELGPMYDRINREDVEALYLLMMSFQDHYNWPSIAQYDLSESYIPRLKEKYLETFGIELDHIVDIITPAL